MKFAIHVHTNGEYADPRQVADLAREAEDAGWDGFFVTDHLTALEAGRPVPTANPWIVLAAAAGATQHIRLGPMVAAVPRRRPWQLASETATLDRLSAGRLVLGVGSGTADGQNFTPFGEEANLRKRAEMLDEALDLLAGMWSGRPFRFQGQHFHLEETTFLPPPIQSPRIPIWVAGTWPHKRPFRRAARWDGFFADVEGVDWLAGQSMPPESVRQIVDYVRSQREGDAPFDAVIGGRLPQDRGRAAALLDAYAGAGLTWWVEGIHPAFGTAAEQRAMIQRGPLRRAT